MLACNIGAQHETSVQSISEPTDIYSFILLPHAALWGLPVREVWQVEMPEHHAGTQKRSQWVGNTFACNVLAHVPRSLLKDGHIGPNICSFTKS